MVQKHLYHFKIHGCDLKSYISDRIHKHSISNIFLPKKAIQNMRHIFTKHFFFGFAMTYFQWKCIFYGEY